MVSKLTITISALTLALFAGIGVHTKIPQNYENGVEWKKAVGYKESTITYTNKKNGDTVKECKARMHDSDTGKNSDILFWDI